MATEGLSEREFERVADEELRKLERALGDVDQIEMDLSMGVLTIEFSDGIKYVINSHRAARQIWMAAERNAWHFDYHDDDGKWTSAKDRAELWSTVEGVLSRKLGSAIALTR
ncbi:iron donor protein CyaY [Polyangium aurulentum]|uniref:iron donor protein CyaY n=1 Tax=Polyangium aurulentum TaxID=2567896 RepID=UPI0010AE84CB|nr:iron donor protein CyaY [Polyangium aurulentum]UQA57898.1 iron donor protein CyaY [Polyangium aurulentum]